jgi:hypothetical protein
MEKVNTDIVLDKRLKDSLERDNYTLSSELCADCESKRAEYIALVECSNNTKAAVLKPMDAIRTGRIIHLRRNVWNHIFDSECPTFPAVFIDIDCYNLLLKARDKQHAPDAKRILPTSIAIQSEILSTLQS